MTYCGMCEGKALYGSVWYVCGGEINDFTMACVWRRNDGVMVCHWRRLNDSYHMMGKACALK